MGEKGLSAVPAGDWASQGRLEPGRFPRLALARSLRFAGSGR